MAALLLFACGGGEGEGDAGPDGRVATPDAGSDGGPTDDAGEPNPDAGMDASVPPVDGGTDDGGSSVDGGATSDAGPEGGTSTPDAGPMDGGTDAGFDGGTDAGFDSGTGTLFPPRDFVCPAGSVTPCLTTVPLRSPAMRNVVVPTDFATTTLTYVVHVLELPEAVGGAAAGFNLDGMDSGSGSTSPTADCEEFGQDFTSVLEPGHVGVDNAFEGLIPTIESLLDPADCGGTTTAGCVDRLLTESINDGSLLILVEIAGVESVLHDPSVTVTLYLGAVPGGGLPTLDASGRLAAGQTFSTVSTIGGPVAGDIFQGRLRVVPGSITFPSLGSLPLVPGTLDRTELRANVSLGGLTSGNLGGTTPVDWFVTEAERVMPGIGSTVRSVLESIADVQPTSDPFVCADVSNAYTWSAVPATRTP